MSGGPIEIAEVFLDDSKMYDQIVREGMAEQGDIKIVSKSNATVGGNPGVVIGFTTTAGPVQAVTTLKLFIHAAQVLAAHHGIEWQPKEGVGDPSPN